MGGVNLLMHGAGWMEGGLHASYEKMILDAELLGMVEAFLDPVVVDEDTLAFDAMESRPGGHFFGAEHTQSRYKTAFHKPMLSDWRNYETWEEAGCRAAVKANRIWKELLAAYEPPPMDPASPRSSTPSSPPRRRGRRPDRRGGCSTGDREDRDPGRRHRRRRRRRQRAVPPDEGRLDRRHAARAARADGGSTWHAAGGMHALNGDPNVARLQQYTIQLYEEIERRSSRTARSTCRAA